MQQQRGRGTGKQASSQHHRGGGDKKHPTRGPQHGGSASGNRGGGHNEAGQKTGSSYQEEQLNHDRAHFAGTRGGGARGGGARGHPPHGNVDHRAVVYGVGYGNNFVQRHQVDPSNSRRGMGKKPSDSARNTAGPHQERRVHRRWLKHHVRGAFRGQSLGQSLLDFKRVVNPNNEDSDSEISDISSVCTADWPVEEVIQRPQPGRLLSQELKEMEAAIEEAQPRRLHRATSGYISVFWDIENCAVPKDTSAYAIVKKIRDRFYKGRREADFVVACDIVKMKGNVADELNNAHVTVMHISSERKNSADAKLKIHLQRFADMHQLSDSTIVLISGDVDFAAELHEMRYRKLIHIVLIHNEQAKKELVDVANESYQYSNFVADLKSKEKNSTPAKEKRPVEKALQPHQADTGSTVVPNPKLSVPKEEKSAASGDPAQPITFGPIGNLIWTYQFANKGCLSAILDALKDVTQCTGTECTLNTKRQTVTVQIPEKFHRLVVNFLQHMVSEEVENLSKKDVEVYADPSSAFRIVLDGKGTVLTVISPSSFRTLKVSDVKISISSFRKWINEFGCVVQYKMQKNEKAFFITYRTTAEAEQAYAAMCSREDDMTVQVIPEQALRNRRVAEQCRPAYRLSVKAVRRHCIGIGFAVLENEASLDSIAHRLPYVLPYGGTKIVCKRNAKEKAQIYMTDIPVAADRDEIRALLNSVLPVKIISVRLIQESQFETGAPESEKIRSNVHEILGGGACLEWRSPAPKDFHFCGVAFFDDIVEGHSVLELSRGSLLKTSRAVPSVPLQLHPILLGSFTLPQPLFLLIKSEFQASLEGIQNGHSTKDNISIEVHAARDGRPSVSIELQANNVNDFRKAVLAVNKALQPVQVLKGVPGQEVMHYIHILNVRDSVFVDCKPSAVHLIGDLGKVADAKARVEEHAAKVAKGACKGLPLLTKEASVVKSFISKYGFPLSVFLNKCNLDKATVDFGLGKVVAYGRAASLKEAINQLASLEVRRMADSEEEFCFVCREVPDEKCHRLESCGHIYCVRCLAWVACNAPLPLHCVSEECGQEWVAMDIRSAIEADEVVQSLLGKRALEECIRNNPSEWFCCPTPWCSYACHYTQLGPSGKEGHCPVCGNAVCFQCSSLFHYGMSCDLFCAQRQSYGFSDEEWVRQAPTRRRLCKGCGAVLEQRGEERVVSCWRCRDFSCWCCRRCFHDAAQARAHTSC